MNQGYFRELSSSMVSTSRRAMLYGLLSNQAGKAGERRMRLVAATTLKQPDVIDASRRFPSV